MTLADLSRLRFGTGQAGERRGAVLPRVARGSAGTGLLAGIFAGIRETEQRQNEAALADWARHCEELSARQLAAARLAWDERFRDLAIRLGEEHDLLLREYAAEVRQEFLPDVSALEMQITMCEDQGEKPALEARLAELLAQIEAKIAQRREGLARQCALELENLRREAEEALAQLEVELQEEAARSWQAFAAAQGEEFAAWLARSGQAEESARRAWGP